MSENREGRQGGKKPKSTIIPEQYYGAKLTAIVNYEAALKTRTDAPPGVPLAIVDFLSFLKQRLATQEGRAAANQEGSRATVSVVELNMVEQQVNDLYIGELGGRGIEATAERVRRQKERSPSGGNGGGGGRTSVASNSSHGSSGSGTNSVEIPPGLRSADALRTYLNRMNCSVMLACRALAAVIGSFHYKIVYSGLVDSVRQAGKGVAAGASDREMTPRERAELLRAVFSIVAWPPDGVPFKKRGSFRKLSHHADPDSSLGPLPAAAGMRQPSEAAELLMCLFERLHEIKNHIPLTGLDIVLQSLCGAECIDTDDEIPEGFRQCVVYPDIADVTHELLSQCQKCKSRWSDLPLRHDDAAPVTVERCLHRGCGGALVPFPYMLRQVNSSASESSMSARSGVDNSWLLAADEELAGGAGGGQADRGVGERSVVVVAASSASAKAASKHKTEESTHTVQQKQKKSAEKNKKSTEKQQLSSQEHDKETMRGGRGGVDRAEEPMQPGTPKVLKSFPAAIPTSMEEETTTPAAQRQQAAAVRQQQPSPTRGVSHLKRADEENTADHSRMSVSAATTASSTHHAGSSSASQRVDDTHLLNVSAHGGGDVGGISSVAITPTDGGAPSYISGVSTGAPPSHTAVMSGLQDRVRRLEERRHRILELQEEQTNAMRDRERVAKESLHQCISKFLASREAEQAEGRSDAAGIVSASSSSSSASASSSTATSPRNDSRQQGTATRKGRKTQQHLAAATDAPVAALLNNLMIEIETLKYKLECSTDQSNEALSILRGVVREQDACVQRRLAAVESRVVDRYYSLADGERLASVSREQDIRIRRLEERVALLDKAQDELREDISACVSTSRDALVERTDIGLRFDEINVALAKNRREVDGLKRVQEKHQVALTVVEDCNRQQSRKDDKKEKSSSSMNHNSQHRNSGEEKRHSFFDM